MSNPFPPGGLNKHPGYVRPRKYVSEEAKAAVVEAFPIFAEHADHGIWEIVSRCVYCACKARLYQT